ncbi:hypothetical protein V9T40_011135 [Parthenolecanium corni]|uniref:Uncharacterized protein n=1 Tax=Parthenolecanium corni TaxID=536013 RepID=A0AAN9XYA0_9HEMI
MVAALLVLMYPMPLGNKAIKQSDAEQSSNKPDGSFHGFSDLDNTLVSEKLDPSSFVEEKNITLSSSVGDTNINLSSSVEGININLSFSVEDTNTNPSSSVEDINNINSYHFLHQDMDFNLFQPWMQSTRTPTDSISSSIQRGDRSSMIQLLEELKRNQLPLPASSTNWTALHSAASKPQYTEYLELLLEYSDSILMDMNGPTLHDEETPLHIACENGCEESVLILLQKGCDPYKVTPDHCHCQSALHIAANYGYSKIIEYLLDYPENINEPALMGQTPLHYAVMGEGKLEVGRILLVEGVDVGFRAVMLKSDCSFRNARAFFSKCSSMLLD